MTNHGLSQGLALALWALSVSVHAEPKKALLDQRNTIFRFQEKNLAPDAEIDPKLVRDHRLSLYIASLHPELQQIIDDLVGLLLESPTARSQLSSTIDDSNSMVRQLGVSPGFAESYTRKPYVPLELEEISQERRVVVALEQIFDVKYVFVFGEDNSNLPYFSWSNIENTTLLFADPTHDGPLDYIKAMIHEMAIRRDSKLSYSSWAIEQFGFHREYKYPTWHTDAVNMGFSVLRAYRFEAQVLGELSKFYDIELSPKLAQLNKIDNRICISSLDEIGRHLVRTRIVSSVTEKAWSGMLKEIGSHKVKVAGKKRSLCEFWSEPALSAPLNLADGGPRPRMGGGW